MIALPSFMFGADNDDQESWVLHGVVLDETGAPMTGISIQVKGTARGATTDLEGKFILEIRGTEEVLRVSFVGYNTQELAPGERREITITLTPNEEDQRLNEVVVVGFGTQKKISVTGAISDVPVKNIQRISTPSLSNALAGSMPGIVTRQSSGEPGYDGAAVYIRGFGTWENRSPLILVDGVERDLNNLNTQEVESFSILKDASATAVYGVRGANGVVLITTKRGAVGKPNIVFRTENAALTALRMPDYINGLEYVHLVNEAQSNEGKNPLYSELDIEKYTDGSEPYLYPNVDWVNTVLKNNTFQTINNLSVSGGTEKVRYYTNVGYTI